VTLDEPEDNHHLEWERIRQTVNCPTCDGHLVVNDPKWNNGLAPCPDCTDGKIPMARLLAVGAAVFNVTTHHGIEPHVCLGERRLGGPNVLIKALRSVQP